MRDDSTCMVVHQCFRALDVKDTCCREGRLDRIKSKLDRERFSDCHRFKMFLIKLHLPSVSIA